MTVGSCFADVVGLLAEVERALCTTQIAVWSGGPDHAWACIASNIESETALAPADFQSLLAEFHRRLAAGESACNAWIFACRLHQRRGAVVPPTHRPQVLGRAMSMRQYADLICEAEDSEVSSRAAAQQFVREHAGRQDLAGHHARVLRRTWLGSHVLWATFNPAAPAADPFDALPRTTAAVRTALGLGHLLAEEPLVLLAYRSDQPDAEWPLCRPTIADAADGPHYRPHEDPHHPHGWTLPLDPNPAGLAPQPELVHAALIGLGLIFPYHIT